MKQFDRLWAGFGRVEITPPLPCFLAGYPHIKRTFTSVHDPLFASALCLRQRDQRILLLSLDLLFVSASWVKDCREAITEATGIPGEAILIAATHTHSGPLTVDILAWRDDPVVPPVDPDYLRFCLQSTTGAAIRAVDGLQKAEAAWTTAEVKNIAGGNRIDAVGVEDPKAGLLWIRESSGSPLALLSIYGMHPTVLHEDSREVSSDFIHFTRDHLEQAFPGLGVVYLNGVCGNQSPRRVVRAQTFAEAERIGRALGRKMERSLTAQTQFSDQLPLGTWQRFIELEPKRFPSLEEAARNLQQARKSYQDLRSGNAPRSEIRTAECTVFGAEEVHTLAKAEASGEVDRLRQSYRQMELQLLRIGAHRLVAWPGEFFVEHGLAVKQNAACPTWITTMANGELHGYIVTPEAEKAGGYEAQMSLFGASNGARVVAQTLDLLKESMNPDQNQ